MESTTLTPPPAAVMIYTWASDKLSSLGIPVANLGVWYWDITTYSGWHYEAGKWEVVPNERFLHGKCDTWAYAGFSTRQEAAEKMGERSLISERVSEPRFPYQVSLTPFGISAETQAIREGYDIRKSPATAS